MYVLHVTALPFLSTPPALPFGEQASSDRLSRDQHRPMPDAKTPGLAVNSRLHRSWSTSPQSVATFLQSYI